MLKHILTSGVWAFSLTIVGSAAILTFVFLKGYIGSTASGLLLFLALVSSFVGIVFLWNKKTRTIRTANHLMGQLVCKSNNNIGSELLAIINAIQITWSLIEFFQFLNAMWLLQWLFIVLMAVFYLHVIFGIVSSVWFDITISREKAQTLRIAAEQGDAESQFWLGCSYDYGSKGVSDAKAAKAMQWIRKSAEQGYAPALFILGMDYLRGRCVPKDSKEAIKYLLRAAEQGHEGAILRLRELENSVPEER